MLISPFHYLILLVITGFILQYFYHLGYLSDFISCWTEMTDVLLVKACIHFFFFGLVKVYRKYPWKLLESSLKDTPPLFFFNWICILKMRELKGLDSLYLNKTSVKHRSVTGFCDFQEILSIVLAITFSGLPCNFFCRVGI